MSDLFVGELLVLVLLLPVLLRPFVAPLQRIPGIAALPLVAFLLAAAMLLGDRFRLSFMPAFAFLVLLFLLTLPRLYRLATGLPTDWYGAGVKSAYLVFLVLFAAASWASWRYAPELSWSPSVALSDGTETVDLGGGRIARVRKLEREGTGSGASVLFVGDGAIGNRPTMALCLAESGYRVIEAEVTGRHSGTALRVPFSFSRAAASVRGLFAVRGLLPSAERSGFSDPSDADLAAITRAIRAGQGKMVPLFAVAEGDGVTAALSLMQGPEPAFDGLACLVPKAGAPKAPGAARLEGLAGFMPANAASSSVLLFEGDPNDMFGFGEIGADDPLAAAVAGGGRDRDRKAAELTARRVLAWFEARRIHDDPRT